MKVTLTASKERKKDGARRVLIANGPWKNEPLYKVQYNYIIECCLKDKNGRLSIYSTIRRFG